MADTKWTKGPWDVEKRGPAISVDIKAIVEGWCEEPVRIASVVPFRNAEANAQLMSAAPDMYEALKELLDFVNRTSDAYWKPNYVKAIKKADAALAKAEGKAVQS